MSWTVRGSLFLEYVRMIRARKDVDWAGHLDPSEDQPYLHARIDPVAWYPMATFERMGLAILEKIAGGSMDAVRAWGYHSTDELRELYPTLISQGDPLETLARFQVLRSTFFGFEALRIADIGDGCAELVIRYGMGDRAEEAATYQAVGFLERLLELAGAESRDVKIVARSWSGGGDTRIAVAWELPAAEQPGSSRSQPLGRLKLVPRDED